MNFDAKKHNYSILYNFSFIKVADPVGVGNL